MTKYRLKKDKDGELYFTEHGHTMFLEDVLMRLERLDYIEKERVDMKEKILELEPNTIFDVTPVLRKLGL